jgi:hypothetical protein
MAATNQDREDNMKNIKGKLSLAIIVCATMCLGSKYIYIEVLPPGWKDASAASINDNGDVAGSGIDSTGIQKGFVYSGGNYTELLPPGWFTAGATSINDNGDVAGVGDSDRTGFRKSFVYSGGNFKELIPPGTRYPFTTVEASSINNNGTLAVTRIHQFFIWGKSKGFIATSLQLAKNS